MSPSMGGVASPRGASPEFSQSQFEELVARVETIEKRLGIETPVKQLALESGMTAEATPQPVSRMLDRSGD